jgi:CysZ protein
VGEWGRSQKSEVRSQKNQPTTNNQQSTINHQPSTINNHQSTINHQQSPINNQPSTITNHQSPITNHQSPITNHQSSITNHQSPITKIMIFNCFSIITGTTYPIRALNLFLRHGYLWQYLMIPIVINICVGLILYFTLLFPSWELIQDLSKNGEIWLEQLIANLPRWLSILEYLFLAILWLFKVIFIVLLFLIIGFIFSQFGTLLGAPWYGKMSEELEKIKTGKVEIVEVSIFRDIWRAILFEFKKIILMLIVGVPLLLCNFIPTIGNLVSTLGGIVLAAMIVCLDFLDSPLERRRLRFRQKLGMIWNGFPATIGFSLVCLGLISIPLLNLVSIPLCVASGTLFFCDRLLSVKGE